MGQLVKFPIFEGNLGNKLKFTVRRLRNGGFGTVTNAERLRSEASIAVSIF